MRWKGKEACMGNMRNADKILRGKRQEKRPIRKSRRRLEDNIRIDHRKIGWEGVDWFLLDQDRDQWRGIS
jgi:hypothetical protein